MTTEDVSTIISIFPTAITEQKPGLFPTWYQLPACKDENEPVVLYVNTAIHLVTLMDDRPALRVETPSWTIAEALVKDFMDGQPWTDYGCKPGFTWARDKLTVIDIKTRHVEILKNLKIQQRKWFERVVEETNTEWNKTHNHRVASSLARHAARTLKIDVPWSLESTLGNESVKCPSCRTLVPSDAIVCATCRCILDAEKHKRMTFA